MMRLAQSGAVAGLCPITESSLGDGIFDGVRWTDAGGAIAVGSDSNIRIALSEELRTLTASMVAMAGALGIETLAEGVETEEAQDVVRSLGFGQLQGFLIARPMSLADTFTWLQTWQDTHAPAPEARAQAAGDPNTP